MGTRMRTRWLIDFDGCVTSTLAGLLNGINQRFGRDYSLLDVTDPNTFWTELPEPFVKWVWSDQCFDRPAFLEDLPPNPGAVDALHALLATECPVVIVTDRPVRHVPWIRQWFVQYDLILPVVSSETRSEDKSVFIDEYRITTVIEDSPTHAALYLQHPGVQKLFLYDAPYNWRITPTHPAERLRGWEDLTTRIQEES